MLQQIILLVLISLSISIGVLPGSRNIETVSVVFSTKTADNWYPFSSLFLGKYPFSANSYLHQLQDHSYQNLQRQGLYLIKIGYFLWVMCLGNTLVVNLGKHYGFICTKSRYLTLFFHLYFSFLYYLVQ